MTEALLFDLTPEPPVKRSVKLRHAGKVAVKPTWTRMRPKNRVPCDECIALLHETSGVGPYAKSARWRRVLNGATLLLCHPHADLWRAEEGK